MEEVNDRIKLIAEEIKSDTLMEISIWAAINNKDICDYCQYNVDGLCNNGNYKIDNPKKPHCKGSSFVSRVLYNQKLLY